MSLGCGAESRVGIQGAVLHQAGHPTIMCSPFCSQLVSQSTTECATHMIGKLMQQPATTLLPETTYHLVGSCTNAAFRIFECRHQSWRGRSAPSNPDVDIRKCSRSEHGVEGALAPEDTMLASKMQNAAFVQLRSGDR